MCNSDSMSSIIHPHAPPAPPVFLASCLVSHVTSVASCAAQCSKVQPSRLYTNSAHGKWQVSAPCASQGYRSMGWFRGREVPAANHVFENLPLPAASLQHGVLRTNCVDCLDRTNVVSGTAPVLDLQSPTATGWLLWVALQCSMLTQPSGVMSVVPRACECKL